MPRPIMLHGRESTEEEIFRYILELIDNGITGTATLSKEIGKDKRTVRRYLVRMSEMGKITLDPHSGRLEHTIVPPIEYQHIRLELAKFIQIPEISRWIKKCMVRGVEYDGIKQMAGKVRNIFDTMKTHPRSVCYSRKAALEFWENYSVEYKKATGRSKVAQSYRTSFRNFLDAHDISFGHGMAKGYGLGSEHDAYKKYAGAYFKPATIEKLTKLMLENGDDEIFLATRLGVRTGARAGALVTMAWDRIYFDQRMSFENTENKTVEFFKLEVHETKDKRGHMHLGKDGEWKLIDLTIDKQKAITLAKNSTEFKKGIAGFKINGTEVRESYGYNVFSCSFPEILNVNVGFLLNNDTQSHVLILLEDPSLSKIESVQEAYVGQYDFFKK
ncbi:MAG: hypothetical protein WCC55_05165 [Nitrosotalea sp.]